jgi:PAS domain-containing protein
VLDSMDRNETRLRQLHDIASTHPLGSGQRLESLLRLGMDSFGLQAGLLIQVRYDTRYLLEDGLDLAPFDPEGLQYPQGMLEVTHWLAQDGSTVSNRELELARAVMSTIKPVLWADQIGVPIKVQDHLFGCLGFSRRSEMSHQQTLFNRSDEDFLILLGQWLGHELEQIESEKQLRERTEQLNAVIEVSPDGFLIMNQHGYITDLNPALLEMTGLEREALVGATDVHLAVAGGPERTLFERTRGERTSARRAANRAPKPAHPQTHTAGDAQRRQLRGGPGDVLPRCDPRDRSQSDEKRVSVHRSARVANTDGQHLRIFRVAASTGF